MTWFPIKLSQKLVLVVGAQGMLTLSKYA